MHQFCSCIFEHYWCYPLVPTGVAAILAQFPNHFRSIAWFNVILGVGYIFLQLVMLWGESSCHCENPCQTHKCPLPERAKFRRMMTCSNLSLILVSLRWLVAMVTSVTPCLLVNTIWFTTLTITQIVGFLLLARGVITSKFVIYEQLLNPILSDSFGFSVKQTSYFFVLLLPATVGRAFSM